MNLFAPRPLTMALIAMVTLAVPGAAQTNPQVEMTRTRAPDVSPNQEELQSDRAIPPALPSKFASHAANYAAFYASVSEISRQRLGKSDQILEATERLTSYDPVLLAEGWMAYAAEIALNTPSFYAAFNERKLSHGRRHLLGEIATKPGFVYTLPESTAAAQLIANMIVVETDFISSVGHAFTSEAKKHKRLGRIQEWPEAPPDIPQSLWTPAMSKKDAAASTLPLPTIDASPIMAPVMKRVLDLAGRITIDAAEGSEHENALLLLKNNRMARCLKWAKLKMQQCKAATRGPSDLAYCTGTHALNERATCWSTLVTVSSGI